VAVTSAWKLVVKRVVGRLGRRRSNHRAVLEFSRSLGLIVDREALEASVGARIRELFNPDRLIILKPDAVTQSFLPGFSAGVDEGELGNLRISSRGKLVRWLSANETCLVVDRQPEVHEYLDPVERELLDRLGVRVCVPMISLNRVTGILLLGSDRPMWGVDRSQVELLNLLASQASLAFENAALYRAQGERLDRLNRAERLAALGQLAAGVAHEIRNPLTAIRSTMQHLQRGFGAGEPSHHLVTEILGEVDRINTTLRELLRLSQPRELQKSEVDLRGLLCSAVELLQAQAGEQEVGVETVFGSAGSAPLAVRGDAAHLRQVFLNLLLNALQSMPSGGRLEVKIVPWLPPSEDPNPRWVEIRIEDTGPGIPPDQLRKVFDPFFTTKRDGTGLGLPICHGIVEQHGGEIHLEPGVGKGTTALVRLPLI
jgi:two-component system, NtrC family, sensor kinase